MRRRIALPIMLCALLTALWLGTPAQAGSFGASPLRYQVAMQPGETRTFTLTVFLPGSSDMSPERFRVYTSDWWHDRKGNTVYASPGTIDRSAAAWISHISPREFDVYPSDKKVIRFTVQVPKDASPGGHWGAILVERQPHPLSVQTEQLIFWTRIAAALYVDVGNLQRNIKFVNLEASRDRATLSLRNTGNVQLRVEGTLEFYRPGSSKPVLEVKIPADVSLPMATLASKEDVSGLPPPDPVREITIVFPGGMSLEAGKYLLRAVVDIGSDHLFGAEKHITIE